MLAIQQQLNRRKPGQSSITTPRKQSDTVQCVSGIENGVTLGSPLCFLVPNQNINKKDYSKFRDIPRPGHADFTYLKKYGVKAESGGGRSSARQTIGRVIAGALAKQFLIKQGILFSSWVSQVGDIAIQQKINQSFIQRKICNKQIENRGLIRIFKSQKQKMYMGVCQQNQKKLLKNQKLQTVNTFDIKQSDQQICQSLKNKILNNPTLEYINTRCPHFESSISFIKRINEAKQKKDSIGGVVSGCVYGMPPGLGQPVFDKLPAVMAHAMLSLPATKGFQYGSGFQGTKMEGSKHNDPFNKDLSLKSNNCGGTLGGISTGSTFQFKVAFKPVSTIGKQQITHDLHGNQVCLQASGRHDPCVLPRAPPIVDNMAAIVIMDLFLLQKIQQ